MLEMRMSVGTGPLMADLINDRTPAFDPAPYRVERCQ
jgi:glycine/D-amino acid oxidase-like deaminating enzyme